MSQKQSSLAGGVEPMYSWTGPNKSTCQNIQALRSTFFAWENLGSWVPHLKCWVGSTSKILQMVTAVHYGKFSGCTYCS